MMITRTVSFKVNLILVFLFSEGRHRPVISITVRQLEAIVRMSEALAKMELLNFAEPRHVDEALRLFQVSTIAAAGNVEKIVVETSIFTLTQ